MNNNKPANTRVRYSKAEVIRTYDRHPLQEETILNRIRKLKPSLEDLSEHDLAIDTLTAITDQNHIGGVKCVYELADRACVNASSEVLDLGCGLGGSSRALAWRFKCHVHGIDFSEKRCREATRLTRLVGLESLVTYECADIEVARPQHNRFDVLWGQSAWVQIADKRAMLHNWLPALRAGGRVAFEDACVCLPVANATDRALLSRLERQWKSYLITPQEWERKLDSLSCSVILREDLTLAMTHHFLALLKSGGVGADDEEIESWRNAVRLAENGVLTYIRIVARNHS